MTSASNMGITSADFTDNALADLGKSLSYQAKTKTTDPVSGDETLTYATAVNKTVVFWKNSQRHVQTKEGLVDMGDATMYSKPADAFVKDDKFVYEEETYLVLNVLQRHANGEHVFTEYSLIKIA